MSHDRNVPVIKEVPVVEKRLVMKEEIHSWRQDRGGSRERPVVAKGEAAIAQMMGDRADDEGAPHEE